MTRRAIIRTAPIPAAGDSVFVWHGLVGFSAAEFVKVANDRESLAVVRLTESPRRNRLRTVPLSSVAPDTPKTREIVEASRAASERGFELLRRASEIANQAERIA